MTMTPAWTELIRTRPIAAAAAIVVAIGGAATILGAWFFQYGLGLKPCPLCLEQRYAYYFAIPLAALVLLGESVGSRARCCCGAVRDRGRDALERRARHLSCRRRVEMVGGPAAIAPARSTASDRPATCCGSLQTISVVRCDEAAWRFLGISLAGYNALISLALAAVAAWAIAASRRERARRRCGLIDRRSPAAHGSSSVSQYR